MTEPSHAVFLSYASQDQEAAQRICAALRAAGIEVWFDQSALRGGDAWDQSIRKQIKSCALFVPLISQHTHERAEGYFRLEWKLAVDRCHLMAADRAFLVPVVIDNTPDDEERVPEKFRELQWTRLPEGQARPEFLTRIQQLLSGESGDSPPLTRVSAPVPAGGRAPLSPTWLAFAVVLAGFTAYLLAEKPWAVKPASPSLPATSANTRAAFHPPPHSIAVLPFVNMSGDKEQDYFSDGLSEELLNSLSRTHELQVAARTSSFYFKGEHADLSTIAHKLNVASVLEGSVRRSGNTIRVTAQLNDAVTGFHLWSQTYDRDLRNVLQLQTEIANAVASALKVTLLGDVGARLEVGGTRNPQAYDAYLRAEGAYWHQTAGASDLEKGIDDYREAVRLDPNFARAYAGWSIALSAYGAFYAHGAERRDWSQRARLPALKSVALTPDLAEGHLALAFVHLDSFDLRHANEEYERAVALAPGNARILRNYGRFAVLMGHTDAGIAAARRAAVLDPLNASSHGDLSSTLRYARRYDEAMVAYQHARSLEPEIPLYVGAYIYYALGNFEEMRSVCERVKERQEDVLQNCLALAYHKLGRHADAEAALARENALEGDAGAVDYAEIYAQWGNIPKALDWLETALRFRNPGLLDLKSEPLLDPLRHEPRFQAIERELKFPE